MRVDIGCHCRRVMDPWVSFSTVRKLGVVSRCHLVLSGRRWSRIFLRIRRGGSAQVWPFDVNVFRTPTRHAAALYVYEPHVSPRVLISVVLTVTSDIMEYVSALEQPELEDLHSSSGEQIEEDPNEIAEAMDQDPEEIHIKDVIELRASRARFSQQFGEIPGVPVGTGWSTREDCYHDGVHRHMRAGIQGGRAKGALSIVASGRYASEDSGDTLIFTGAWGRQSRGGRRQACDQHWTGQGNEALRVSQRTGKPVRVVRGDGLKSEFAPIYGYRYDGLYTVKAAWRGKNKEGFYLCRYRLERVPGQPPIRVRSDSVGFYMRHGYLPLGHETPIPRQVYHLLPPSLRSL
ncbi:PUA-like domain-containing protein [Suillus placidus]|uniref:PUA-like domain-containing protein n=1 Tax=Suillus placidus TaxID=48579 RepID=A0A9P7A524_9AGAM|nr:PUA-like domain-containing protein [Suillus placidus]